MYKKLFSVTVMALAFTAFSSHALVSGETKQLADRLGASALAEVSFSANQTALTESEKAELSKLITEAKKKGEIKEVKLLVWPDREYPAPGRELSTADVKVVKARIGEIEKYLKDLLYVSSVESYNMAERPNTMEKMFNTSDAKMKKQAEATGAAPSTAGETGIFGWKGQASKAVAMVFIK